MSAQLTRGQLDHIKRRMASDEIYLSEGRDATPEEIASAVQSISDEAAVKYREDGSCDSAPVA